MSLDMRRKWEDDAGRTLASFELKIAEAVAVKTRIEHVCRTEVRKALKH